MHTLFIRFFMVIAMAFAASGAISVSAGPLSDGEAKEIQGVIVAQIEAFADDDAERAFQTATPSVREAIGNSSRFLAMVRGVYPMVYRSASLTFHKLEEENGSVLQLVEITDTDSKSWLAMYALEQQPDASWRISGCMVVENRWRSI